MKKILILLVFISSTCLSQEMIFNFEKNKVYKIKMEGANDFKKADHIARLMEKTTLSLFSYVDSTNGTGYFIVDNFYKVHEIEKMINNEKEIKFLSSEEIPLTEDLFIEMYMKRGGYESTQFSLQPPKKIVMGPFNGLSNSLFEKATEIWEKKFKVKN
jgi:hypothetical protein